MRRAAWRRYGRRVHAGYQPRVATAADVEAVSEIFAGAFFADPVWGWAFPDPHAASPNTGRSGASSWRTPSLTIGSGERRWRRGGALDPAGAARVSAEDEAKVEPLLTELLGAEQAAIVLETQDRFDASHPREEPHYYLSLLATGPSSGAGGSGWACSPTISP